MSNSKTPPSVEDVVALALQLSPEDRALLADLLQALTMSENEPPPEWHLAEVRAALKEHQQNPDSAVPLEEATRELDELLKSRKAARA
jgi:hypothetical protein